MTGRPIVDVSVVLPCYKAAPLARRSVDQLCRSLPSTGLEWEIVVVDDGGGDFSDADWKESDRVRLIRFTKNCGKGAAVREGMLTARGDVRIYTDVDLPFGVDPVPVIRQYLRGGFHMVVGDRTLPGATYRESISRPRRIASAVFTSFVGTLVTGGFFDTQCGLKGVRGDIADHLFPLLTIDRFAFDVELIYVALKHRLDIKRIPVTLLNNETSSVRLLRDASRGVSDIARIKINQMARRYDSSALDAIVSRDHESVVNSVLQEFTT
jgi:dolichyl-phosphate beta-glucosyltransferase